MEIFGSYHTDTELYFLKYIQSYREVIKNRQEKQNMCFRMVLAASPRMNAYSWLRISEYYLGTSSENLI